MGRSWTEGVGRILYVSDIWARFANEIEAVGVAKIANEVEAIGCANSKVEADV